jgi:hypothetical protein
VNQSIGGEHPGAFTFPNRYPGTAPQQKSKIGAGEHFGVQTGADSIDPKPGAAAPNPGTKSVGSGAIQQGTEGDVG